MVDGNSELGASFVARWPCVLYRLCGAEPLSSSAEITAMQHEGSAVIRCVFMSAEFFFDPQ
jgi:hypothetical protein